MRIVVSRNADFQRDKGKSVMEAILKSPEGAGVTAVYAENDDMALGAIQALEEAGKKPGTEVILVSVDAIREGLQAIIDGKLNCAIECNPLLGPAIMDTAKKLKAGEAVPPQIISKEELFDDPAQVKAIIGSRKY
jgi:simple sugar transport system substrate-binding protein